jgi:hypothetical protein
MLHTLIGIFIVLHGLVHMWFVTLSREWVEFQPEMGWTGESWLLSGFLTRPTTRTLATVLFGLGTIAFVVGGVTVLARASWSRTALIASAAFSLTSLLLFWDGGTDRIVARGLVGVLLNIVILVGALISR